MLKTNNNNNNNNNNNKQLIQKSRSVKAEANKLFFSACYDQAVSTYDRAIALCPTYLDYEIAVLKSNVAACYLKLEDWKSAADSASECIGHLDNIFPPNTDNGEGEEKDKKTTGENEKGQKEDGGDAVVEISGDDNEEEELERLRKIDEKKRDVLRIRTKALIRRARAKLQLGGWGNLQAAEEDYKVLAGLNTLSPDDMRVVTSALRDLPEKINKARDQEMAEMMGKLKEVCGFSLSLFFFFFCIP